MKTHARRGEGGLAPPGRPGNGLAGAFSQEPELILACLEGVERESPATARLILEAARGALRQCPGYADLLYHASQAAVCAGEFETAAVLLEHALQVNPGYRDALILAARVSLRRDDWDRAQALLQTALAQGADYPDVHMLLGDVWRRKGRIADARREYERALQLNANLVSAQVALAALPPSKPSGNPDELPA